MMQPRVLLVTGSTGFVGSAVVRRALAEGWSVRATARRVPTADCRLPAETVLTPDLSLRANWRGVLDGVDAVVHCAARVHVTRETARDALLAFREINTEGTLRLAHQAVAAGVKRFVFLSTIGVNGAETLTRPFGADDPPSPHSPYSVSKHEAEQELRGLAAKTGLEVVIIRPPLVYGPSAPGNFGSLMRAVHSGMPMPLGAVDNRRSLIALDNLVDFIIACIEHAAATSHVFLVSDGEDTSTPDLVRRLAHAMGKPARLLPVPPMMLVAAAAMTGKLAAARSLCASLQVDISKARTLLGWKPPLSIDEGLRRAAAELVR